MNLERCRVGDEISASPNDDSGTISAAMSGVLKRLRHTRCVSTATRLQAGVILHNFDYQYCGVESKYQSAQNGRLGSLISRVVIPLTRVAGNCTASKVAQALAPLIDIVGELFVLETPLFGVFRTSDLGRAIGSLKDEQDRIGAALDRVLGAS